MPDYPDLATLRSALTAEDSERRAEAYGVVYEKTDFTPTDVLNNDGLVEDLRAVGVIETPEDRPSALQHREEVVELLERIAVAVEGS